MQAKVIKSVDSEGKDFTIVVKAPTRTDLTDAQCYSSQIVRKAMKAKVPTRAQLRTYMEEEGVWDEKKEKELKEFDLKIKEGEKQLKRGGVTKDGQPFSKADARKLAVNMRMWRLERMYLMADYMRLDEYCLESQAENAKTNFLTSSCTFNESGDKVYKDIDDYMVKFDEPYSMEAATYMSFISNGVDPDSFDKNAENDFLVEHKFANEDGRLIDEDGNFVDMDGNPVIEIKEEEEVEFTPFSE